MKKTGAILKEAREKKGISIYEVSTATKINTRNIMAMEEGAVDRLPPKTFLRGFVASYATFLQIDTAEILKIFFEEMGSTRPEVALRDEVVSESKTDQSAVAALSDNKKIGYFKIYGIIGIVILIVVIGIIKRKMDSYESESIQATTPIAIAPETAALNSPSPSPAGSPNSSANLPPLGTPAEVVAALAAAPSPTPKPTAIPLPLPTATPQPTPTPEPEPMATPKPTPKSILKPTDSAATASLKPSPSPTPAGRPQEVVIEALDDVDIVLQIDNEPSKKMTLHHDEVQSIKARRKVRMTLSDGGAVNLIVNGKDRGVPGDLGKPKKVDVP